MAPKCRHDPQLCVFVQMGDQLQRRSKTRIRHVFHFDKTSEYGYGSLESLEQFCESTQLMEYDSLQAADKNQQQNKSEAQIDWTAVHTGLRDAAISTMN